MAFARLRGGWRSGGAAREGSWAEGARPRVGEGGPGPATPLSPAGLARPSPSRRVTWWHRGERNALPFVAARPVESGSPLSSPCHPPPKSSQTLPPLPQPPPPQGELASVGGEQFEICPYWLARLWRGRCGKLCCPGCLAPRGPGQGAPGVPAGFLGSLRSAAAERLRISGAVPTQISTQSWGVAPADPTRSCLLFDVQRHAF